MVWFLATAAVYGALLAGRIPSFPFRSGGAGAMEEVVACAGAYLFLGVLLIGSIARGLCRVNPVLWRPLALLAGVVLAVLQGVSGASDSRAAGSMTMAAVLGLALAALLGRLVPEAVVRTGLGVERRRHPSCPP
ncbi:MAG: hypothetical protein ACYDGU_10450, partial [Acidiferrobacterales bacterium]